MEDIEKEEVIIELKRILLSSAKPSVGFKSLVDDGTIEKYFPSLFLYPPVYDILDKAVHFCNDLSEDEKLLILFTVLLWLSEPKALDELNLEGEFRNGIADLLESVPSRELVNDYEHHLLSQFVNMRLLSRVLYAFSAPSADKFADTIERLGIEEKPVEPIITEEDLLATGIESGEKMNKILSTVYDLQLRGATTSGLWNTVEQLSIAQESE